MNKTLQALQPKEASVKQQERSDRKVKIEVDSVSFAYSGQTILDQISLQVREGEFTVLMGPSGCGKSTLLRLISGLASPQQGTIEIKDSKQQNGQEAIHGMVFQDYSLFPWLSAGENVVLALRQIMKGSKKELRHLAEQYLRLVNLEHAYNKYPGQLSGGMKQRVAIARALALSADLLLFDEPFGALDPVTRLQLQDLIVQLWQDQRKTALFVTHDVEEALFLADRIILFTPGPGSVISQVVEVPFPRPRNRKKLTESQAFSQLREQLLNHMNRALLDRLESPHVMGLSGSGI
ncbi:bacitracin ABC transporter ATP-binding protein [Paenibacillus curdlanolyticus]|nr:MULTISPECIES: ABC transporter ATP-binding protein [Paenibacillus]GFN31424.1 bacitracin ABC transporter ATP-binding protein [Paenibacillus curdlanolyticus]